MCKRLRIFFSLYVVRGLRALDGFDMLLAQLYLVTYSGADPRGGAPPLWALGYPKYGTPISVVGHHSLQSVQWLNMFGLQVYICDTIRKSHYIGW